MDAKENISVKLELANNRIKYLEYQVSQLRYANKTLENELVRQDRETK